MTISTDLAFARAFVAPLTLGVNVERNWGWNVPGGPAAYAAYLKSIGVTHVRLFYAYRPDANMLGYGTRRPTQWEFSRLLDAAAAYIAAGIKVFLYFADVLYRQVILDNRADITAHVTDCAGWCAQRAFDNTMICYGVANELASDDSFTDLQIEWHGIMRNVLPDYLLACGANYWQAWTYLTASTRWTTDDRTIWPVHIYEAHDLSGWENVAYELGQWSSSNGGVVVTVDEIGGGYQSDSQNPAVWTSNLSDALRALGSFKPMLWATTYGSEWRINNDQDGTLRPALESLVITVADELAPSTPVDPVDPPPVITPPGGLSLGALWPGALTGQSRPIALAAAIVAAQSNFDQLAMLGDETTAALVAVNATLAKLLPKGPYASAAAASGGGVEPGGTYYDATGALRVLVA